MTFMALQSVPIESSYSLHRTYNFEKIHESFHSQFSFFFKYLVHTCNLAALAIYSDASRGRSSTPTVSAAFI